MNPAMTKALMRGTSRLAVALYRLSGGRIGGRAAGGVPVLLLTVKGRKTGTPHTHCVGYFEHEGGWLVVGSAGGLPQEPQWFRNLRVADRAEVQVRREQHAVTIRVLPGPERDAAWRDIVVARCPPFAKYETKTTRSIPIAHLTPVG